MIGIYKITSPSGKIYIGQSLDIEKRFNYYCKLKCVQQPRLYYSFLKHGVENHLFEVIEECEILELNNKERYWQEFYNCVGESGLNCVLTKSNDRSGKHSEKTILKMSKSSLGQKPTFGFKGRKHSDETKTKMSKKAIGHKRPLGIKRTEAQKIRISNSKLGNKSKSKLVLNLENGIFYESVKETCNYYNFKRTTLTQKLNGIKKNTTQFIYA